MTITVAPARNEYTANPGQTIFNYTFKIFENTDLNVYITPAGQEANDSTDITTSYTVDPSGIGTEDGGFITLSSGASLGDLVTIVSNIPSSRTVDYQNNGDFRPEAVNNDFDRVVSIVKKIEDTSNRSLLLAQAQQDPKPLSLEEPKAGLILVWNDSGTGVTSKTVSALSPGDIDSSTIEYVFNTVAEYKTYPEAFPVGKRIFLKDRNAYFEVISGTSSTGDYGTITSDTVNQSIEHDDDEINIRAYGAPNGTDDTGAFQAALNTLKKVKVPFADEYIVSTITIPSNSLGLHGDGTVTTASKIKHKAGATGNMIQWESPNRVINTKISGLYLEGNGESGEGSGIDLSGFSYSHFEDLYIRLFNEDGLFGDGSITPVVQQISNNTFIHVRTNNNTRDGLRLDAAAMAGNENTANTFIGCEFAGNGGVGVNEIWGESNVYQGCVSQGNALKDIKLDNSRFTSWDGYIEGTFKAVELTSNSSRNSLSTRSSFPLWNTFDDSGTQNQVSIKGEQLPETDIFNNTWLADWSGVAPDGIVANGAVTFSSVTDTASKYGASVVLGVDANFQGIVISLDEASDSLAGKWVTVVADIDVSSYTDTLQNRIYTRDDSALNTSVGEWALFDLDSSGSEKVYFDVKFTETTGTTKDILWYLSYSGLTTTNDIKVKSLRVIYGQSTGVSDTPTQANNLTSVTTAILSDATSGVNIHRKQDRGVVFETSTGKLRYAIGGLPTSAWRATDGSGDITPI